MKKILYIVNHIDWFWSHRLPIVKAAKDAGWEVHVAVAGSAKDPRFAQHGFISHELPLLPGTLNPFPALGLLMAIENIIREVKPDVMHAITIKHVFFAGLAVKRHKDIRTIHTIAGLGYLFSAEGFKPKLMRTVLGPILKLSLRNSMVTVQNQDDRNILIQRGFVIPEKCIIIPGSGIDTTAFAPKPENEKNPPCVVMATRLLQEKGVSIFVEAARILKKRGVNARFIIAGDLAPYAPRALTAEDMKKMTADGAAEWPGKVTDMPPFYAASSVVVYPSWYREGIPKVLLEAAAAGKPIITTDHSGCRDAVRNNDNGILVPVKDAAATANAIEKLLKDKNLRHAMGLRSRERAEKEFDVRIVVKETLRLYG